MAQASAQASALQRRVMVERSVFTDLQIQDYIDGRLNERDRAAVAAYLLAHPQVAAEVEAVRRQSEALRALGHEVLDEPVPERLRQVLREGRPSLRAELTPRAPRGARPRFQRVPSFLEAAAAILLFCAGGALGWFVHGTVRPAPSIQDMLLADMSRAYALYGARDYPVAFPPDRAEEFVTWIDQSFARQVRPPDLAGLGYSYRGGRVFPGARANIGLFQFERPEHAALAVFFWTTAAPPLEVVQALYDHDKIAAHFWNTKGLNFAVISDKANQDLGAAAEAIFAFYAQALDAS